MAPLLALPQAPNISNPDPSFKSYIDHWEEHLKQYIDKSIEESMCAYEKSITIPSCPPHDVVIKVASPSTSAANRHSRSQPHYGTLMNSYPRQPLPPASVVR